MTFRTKKRQYRRGKFENGLWQITTGETILVNFDDI